VIAAYCPSYSKGERTMRIRRQYCFGPIYDLIGKNTSDYWNNYLSSKSVITSEDDGGRVHVLEQGLSITAVTSTYSVCVEPVAQILQIGETFPATITAKTGRSLITVKANTKGERDFLSLNNKLGNPFAIWIVIDKRDHSMLELNRLSLAEITLLLYVQNVFLVNETAVFLGSSRSTLAKDIPEKYNRKGCDFDIEISKVVGTPKEDSLNTMYGDHQTVDYHVDIRTLGTSKKLLFKFIVVPVNITK
jgi:hypothetical protein